MFVAGLAGASTFFLAESFGFFPGVFENEPDNRIKTSVPEYTQADYDTACNFYTAQLNILDLTHFRGAATASHEDMVKGAYQSILKNTYRSEFYDTVKEEYDESAITFEDPKTKETVLSLKLSDNEVLSTAVFNNAVPMQSYRDHCAYIETGARQIAAETDIEPFRVYEYALNGAINASRDIRTHYQWHETATESQIMTNGQYIGIGAVLALEHGLPVVQQPMPGSPALKSGLQPGDVITHVDGENVAGKTLQETVQVIRGDVNTDVTLTIKRDNQANFDVTITRNVIELESVVGKIVGEKQDTLHIVVKDFSDNTPANVRNNDDTAGDLNALYLKMTKQARDNGTPIKNIVVDFRNNGGGLLTQALKISDMLLQQQKGKENLIVAYGKTPKNNKAYIDSITPDEIEAENIIILQNQFSASASEIVAGAAKDSGLEVVGTTSYGKGSVQNLRDSTDTDGNLIGTLTYTVGLFFPGNSGKSSEISGIIPNTTVVYNDFRDDSANKQRATKEHDETYIDMSLTRDGNLPERTCTLKKEFSGALSDQQLNTIPEELTLDGWVVNQQNNEREAVKLFDADLDCALNRVNGDSKYTVITTYEPPKPASAKPTS